MTVERARAVIDQKRKFYRVLDLRRELAKLVWQRRWVTSNIVSLRRLIREASEPVAPRKLDREAEAARLRARAATALLALDKRRERVLEELEAAIARLDEGAP